MELSECLPLDEVFTHIDEQGEVRHFNPSAMYRAIPSLILEGSVQRIEAEMDRDFINFIVYKRGVEDYKLDRMCEPFLSVPVIGIDWPDGSVLTVDGHHRLVVLAAHGVETYSMYRFPLGEWERFLVKVPNDLSEFMAADTLYSQRPQAD